MAPDSSASSDQGTPTRFPKAAPARRREQTMPEFQVAFGRSLGRALKLAHDMRPINAFRMLRKGLKAERRRKR